MPIRSSATTRASFRRSRDDFHVSDYSPWEGWQVEGWPVMTILRGKVIVENGKLLGKARRWTARVAQNRSGRAAPASELIPFHAERGPVLHYCLTPDLVSLPAPTEPS